MTRDSSDVCVNGVAHAVPLATRYAASDSLPPGADAAAHLAAVVDSSEDAIVTKTADGLITGWNRSAERIYGYTAEEMIGRHISELIPLERREEEASNLERVLRGERLSHFRTQRRTKDGRALDVSVTISPIRDATGTIVGAAKIARDVSEQTRLEDELRASEHRLRDLIQSLPQLVWTCQGDGPCDYLSPQWVAYTGIPESEQLGYGWLEQIHPDDREATREKWAEAAAFEGAFDQAFRIRRHDGVYRWFKTRATPFRDAQGRVTRWFGTNTDVQDLRDAQETLVHLNERLEERVQERTRELRVAHERTRLATHAAGMGVWDWNVAADSLVWDETMCRLYGLEDAEFDGSYETWRARVHPDDLVDAELAVREAVEGRQRFDTSFRVLHEGDVYKRLRAVASVIRDEDGRPTRMIGVNWDNTKQRETELALEANEALLREFVRHAPAAIAMLDRDLRYLQASDQWLRDYKLADVNIIGRHHYEVFPDIPDRWKTIHQRVLRGAVEGCLEEQFPRADGTVEWLQWEARPWRGADGEIAGVIFFTQVITARKELEMRLRQQKSDLEQSNRDLEQFAYAASHDLQEPLRAVSGCAQILSRTYRGRLDRSADELIDHIVDGADRMRTLINDLLAYSRVATHGVEIEPVESGRALSRALVNLAVAVQEGGATVEVGAMPTVRADEGQLTVLFQNLIGNALKYRGERAPRIRVVSERRDEGWEFSVSDNGIGIEAAYFDRIFVLFQRLHTRTEYPGTGIGLALCQKIVERHGGRIWVTSTPNTGSDFRFVLPDHGDGA